MESERVVFPLMEEFQAIICSRKRSSSRFSPHRAGVELSEDLSNLNLSLFPTQTILHHEALSWSLFNPLNPTQRAEMNAKTRKCYVNHAHQALAALFSPIARNHLEDTRDVHQSRVRQQGRERVGDYESSRSGLCVL